MKQEIEQEQEDWCILSSPLEEEVQPNPEELVQTAAKPALAYRSKKPFFEMVHVGDECKGSDDLHYGFSEISSMVSHDSLVIALDVGTLMSTHEDGDCWEGQSPMGVCLDSIRTLVENKLKYYIHDEFSLLLYNTSTTQNQFGLKNAFLLHPLQPVSLKTLSDISQLKDGGNFWKAIGTEDSSKVALNDLLGLITQIYASPLDKNTLHRVWILRAHNKDETLSPNEEVLEKLRLLKGRNILVQAFEILSSEDKPKSILGEMLREVYGESEGNIHPALKLSCAQGGAQGMSWGEALQASSATILRKQMLRRTRCSIPAYATVLLEVAPGLHLGLAIYKPYIRKKVPCPNSKKESVELAEEVKEDILNLCRTIEYGGEQVHLTKSEISQARNMGVPGLKLLGFRSQTEFRVTHHMAPNYLLYPNEKVIPGSLLLFKAMLVKMATLRVGAVAWYTCPRRSTPLLVALLPQLETLDEAGQISPPCWTMSILPSSEEFRHIPLHPEPAIPDEHNISKLLSVIEQMPVANERGFDPIDFENPAHTLHFKALHALANGSHFNPDQAALEPWTQLTPISQECQNLLTEIEKNICPRPPPGEDAPASKKHRKS